MSDDGWLYFGNVFDSTGGFKFGFGPFAAPTTSGQISGIASGEGGPDQGNNQLVVFSNYDCCQPGEGHFGTDLVETIVFQEIASIPADFIGQIFTFEFDAKRGNIEDADDGASVHQDARSQALASPRPTTSCSTRPPFRPPGAPTRSAST